MTQDLVLMMKEIKAIELKKDLGGSHSQDYISAVEPSVLGGEKLAKYYLQHLF